MRARGLRWASTMALRRPTRSIQRCPAPHRWYIAIAASNFASASARFPVDSSAEPQLLSASASSSGKPYLLKIATAFSKWGANGRSLRGGQAAFGPLDQTRSAQPVLALHKDFAQCLHMRIGTVRAGPIQSPALPLAAERPSPANSQSDR